MPSTLWVPQAQAQRDLETRRAHEARLLGMVETKGTLDYWNKLLKEIDPYLELVRAKEDADPLPGLKPGFYHVLRHNPGAAPDLKPLEHEDGSFREPDSSLFDWLRSLDMWQDRVMSDRRAKARKLELAAENQKAREREERKDEFLGRFKALESPGIRFGGSWTNKAGARRG